MASAGIHLQPIALPSHVLAGPVKRGLHKDTNKHSVLTCVRMYAPHTLHGLAQSVYGPRMEGHCTHLVSYHHCYYCHHHHCYYYYDFGIRRVKQVPPLQALAHDVNRGKVRTGFRG